MTSTDAQRSDRPRLLLAAMAFSAVVAILATAGVLYTGPAGSRLLHRSGRRRYTRWARR
jgi:hypothetical protein